MDRFDSHFAYGVIVRGTLQSTRVEKNYVLGVKSCFLFSFFLFGRIFSLNEKFPNRGENIERGGSRDNIHDTPECLTGF